MKLNRLKELFFKSAHTVKEKGVVYFLKVASYKVARDFGRLFRSDYQSWILHNQISGDRNKLLKDLKINPLISIVIPAYQPERAILESTINSVTSQIYSNWELCISVSSPVTDMSWLDSHQSEKIKISYVKNKVGISENTKLAINLSSGDYVGFLDHDDLLSSDALVEVVKAIQEFAPDFIYSDEDRVDAKGRIRSQPHFKPDFSPELLLSMNYITHFSVVKKELGEKIGWLRSEYDGSQDYDFVLRCFEAGAKFHHIPKILYHWRAVESSSLSKTGLKPYAHTTGLDAVNDHLNRRGLRNLSAISGKGTFRYRLQSDFHNSVVSIIIPNKDQYHVLKKCIDSIMSKSTYKNFEIIIVENNSVEPGIFDYYDKLRGIFSDQVKIITWKDPFNYSAINNFAVKESRGDKLLFLNNDIEVISPDWIERMLDFFHIPGVGAVGAKLYYPNDKIQHAGVIIGLGGVAGHSHKFYHRSDYGFNDRLIVAQNLSAVTGACLLTTRNVFDQVCGFDEGLKVAFNDVDFCLKIRQAGYRIVWTPDAELYHHESISRGYENTPEKIQRFNGEVEKIKSKWGSILKNGDPYYNVNLTLDYEDFSLKKKVVTNA